MNENAKNGAATAAEQPKPGTEPAKEAATIEAAIDAQITPIVATMWAGILASMAGMPPPVVLAAFARVSGKVCASAVSGPLAGVLAARKQLQEFYQKGMSQVPTIEAPKADPALFVPPGVGRKAQ